jgi:hypothetical protein
MLAQMLSEPIVELEEKTPVEFFLLDIIPCSK